VIALMAVVATTAWIALLVAAPALPGWAGAMIYGLGSVICHQIPERSFYLSGFQLPVCARCLGIYAGAAGAAVLAAMRSRSGENLVSGGSANMRRLGVVAATPTLLTVALEMAGVWHPSNATRAVAGFPLGGLVALVVVSALATLHYRECAPPRPTAPKPPQRFI
jgi:uncharacterized membrane protein